MELVGGLLLVIVLGVGVLGVLLPVLVVMVYLVNIVIAFHLVHGWLGHVLYELLINKVDLSLVVLRLGCFVVQRLC